MIRKLLRKFHRHEAGTALTEFIIVLPIFILIFSFMASFQKQTNELNRIRYRAATQMWVSAMDVQRAGTSPSTTHAIPIMGANAANNIVGGSPSFAGDASQQVIIGGLAAGNTPGELRAGSLVAGYPAPDPTSGANLKFSKELVADGMMPLPSAQSNAVKAFNFAILRTVGVTRHAGILGTRYGAVEGKHSGTITSWPWGSPYTFNAQYDVLVSPVSIPSGDEMFVVGASRLLADQDPCLNTVLEISTGGSDC